MAMDNLNSRWATILLWGLSITYIVILLLSPPGQLIPGEPAWAIQPETRQEILNESVNFFFILPLLNAVGISVMAAPTVHPVTEALFNLSEAWMFMFLPLLLADRRGQHLPQRLLWGLSMFLTNTFLGPYMALRTMQPLETGPDTSPELPLWNRILGWIGLVVSLIAIPWFLVARPEFGDVSARFQYMGELLRSDRLTLAFCIDLTLFALFQIILLGAVEPINSSKRWLRFIPGWGLALWLIL